MSAVGHRLQWASRGTRAHRPARQISNKAEILNYSSSAYFPRSNGLISAAQQQKSSTSLRRAQDKQVVRSQAKDKDSEEVPSMRRMETLSTRMGGKDDSYDNWNTRLPLLRASKIHSITPVEAMAKLEVGNGVLIDVREEAQYNELHPTGAINVPLFIPCANDSDYDKLRTFAYKLLPALQGTPPTDRNPNFILDILEVVDEGQVVILLCDRGGNIDKWPFPYGVESRSFIAAHELLSAGLHAGRILHVKGGMLRWVEQGHDCSYIPGEGESVDEEDDVGYGYGTDSDSNDEWDSDVEQDSDDEDMLRK